MDKVRCTVCRGAKKMMKLGGMTGSCNLCKGTGEINQCDVPIVQVQTIEQMNNANMIKQVANAKTVTIASKTCLPESETVIVDTKDVDVKVDGKRAIYKRKNVGK